MQPSVLLLDEPLGALDKQLREQMQVEIRRIHDELGVTIFHVTHDQEEALTLSDRIAVMNKGRVAQIGRPDELYARPSDLFVAQFIGRGNFLKAEVKSCNHAETVVALAAGPSMSVSRRSSSGALAVGDEIRCLIRPEHVMFAAAASDSSGIEATIVDKIFVGEAIEISATFSNGERITGRRTTRETEGLQQGQKVKVNWDAADCYILDMHGPS